MYGMPADQITVLSWATNQVGTSTQSGSFPPGVTYDQIVTAFKHNTLNLIVVSDGGFLSSEQSRTSYIYCPFGIDAVTKRPYTAFLGTSSTNFLPVSNSALFGNMIGWAAMVTVR
jgi:hypothetical protein